jgi:crotonobetainyl-CoA:carnitine CoA-transferase CaiB-like acyl-CoA transferase
VSREGQGIFSDLRILELGSGIAGPAATRYFAARGATVVRIESARRPDFLRLLHLKAGSREGLDDAPLFVLLNPDKWSVSLDLSRPEGLRIARRLVAWADVVSENFAPGVVAKWGLDYESLRRSRPDLIMVSACLFGQTGPQRSYPGFGGQGSAIAGFNHLTGWPDREAIGPYGTITDSLSPRYVALLIAAALLERRRTGQGQYIDLSQIEAGVYSLSEAMLRCSANGDAVERQGNHAEHAAPHAIYPCRGDERWIAIAVFSDAQWQALVGVMGSPAWARDARFATAAGRLAHQAELDEHLAAWTRELEPVPLMERLQEHGVEAGMVQTFEDLLKDPQLEHRQHFQRLSHAQLGELFFEHAGFRLSDSPATIERPAPGLGEHNEAVLADLLGLDPEEIQRLADAGVLE